MNKDKLKSIIKVKSNGDSNQSLHYYQMFFFEHLLERISISKYNTSFILKGGMLLASFIGDDKRTTKDMDMTMSGINFDEKQILKVLDEIISIDINDDINYSIIDVKDIREEDEYGGFKINLLCTYQTIKLYMYLELTCGDKITPGAINYNYKCIFDDKVIPIFSYNVETVIAEKFETIISRGILNSRMKDFYDLYMINHNNVVYDEELLKIAIKNTFDYRNDNLTVDDIRYVIDLLKEDISIKKQWDDYKDNVPYASNIEYDQLFDFLYEIANEIKDLNIGRHIHNV